MNETMSLLVAGMLFLAAGAIVLAFGTGYFDGFEQDANNTKDIGCENQFEAWEKGEIERSTMNPRCRPDKDREIAANIGGLNGEEALFKRRDPDSGG